MQCGNVMAVSSEAVRSTEEEDSAYTEGKGP